jgi:hypothetical protein
MTITVLVALALLIFAVYKVFSNSPFTLPSYVAFYIVILTVFVFFFPLTRTYLEYRTLNLLAGRGLLQQYVAQFLSDSESAEDSIIAVKGEVRLVIALTIMLILGISLFQLIVTTGFDEYVKSILAVFTGAITSIVGFYFGSRASKEGGTKPGAKRMAFKIPGGNGPSTTPDDHQKNEPQTSTRQTPSGGGATTPSDHSFVSRIQSGGSEFQNALSQLEETISSIKQLTDDLARIKANVEEIKSGINEKQ